MLEYVGNTYIATLNAIEREIYEALPENERVAFRICRDLALLKEQNRPPLTFFLSFNHLADRIGVFPPQAQRIMRRLESYGLIKMVEKGTRREAGVPGISGSYQWQIPP